MNERIGITDKKPETKSQNLAPQIRRKTESFQSMSSPVDRILFLQRTIGNHAVSRMIESGELQAKLRIGQPGDVYEQEADRVAEQVMRMPEVSDTKDEKLQAKETASQTPEVIPKTETITKALKGGGQPLPESTRAFMESRFGQDFSQVRVHFNENAVESSRAVDALAYTVGRDVVFGAGQYVPGTREGKRLIAHELTHVLQQEALPSTAVMQRQPGGTHEADMDLAAEREYGKSGAPKSQTCGRPSWCPAGFCSPYSSEKLAQYYRSKKAWWLMAGISAAVDSRVVPLWREYLWGGSPPKNLTADFAKDFTNSPTTKKTTAFLYDELKKSFTAKPPFVPQFSNTYIDITTQIPTAIAALGDPASRDQMNFNIPKDIPGNLAGGIGKDQLACPAGAQPSPFNDERLAKGMVRVVRTSGPDLIVTPSINYTVKDTIDLCPGDCGTALEQIATVPLSQFEATGISGDVPFTVEFPAPFLGPFTVSAPLPPTPGPAPSPKKP
ncbi:hypothetical protein METP3_00349 [Methanosarcinales archaeon]|nr:hypothetical protein METP3_00349 [Methanosarcinales archaeon]